LNIFDIKIVANVYCESIFELYDIILSSAIDKIILLDLK